MLSLLVVAGVLLVVRRWRETPPMRRQVWCALGVFTLVTYRLALPASFVVRTLFCRWLLVPTDDCGLVQGCRVFRLAPAARDDRGLIELLSRSSSPVLEIPTTMRVGAEAMYRQIWHQRPVLNGYGRFIPQDAARRSEFVARLPDRAALVELRRATGVGEILVHVRGTRNPRRWRALVRRREGSGLRLVPSRPGVLLFEVRGDESASARQVR